MYYYIERADVEHAPADSASALTTDDRRSITPANVSIVPPSRHRSKKDVAFLIVPQFTAQRQKMITL
jgi:hypothetical protein